MHHVLSILSGVGCLTGLTLGLVGYALDITLSPLVVGSISAIVSTILSSIFCVGFASIFDGSPNYKRNSAVLFSTLCFSGTAVGIGLSAAINAVSSIILDIESAAKLGAAMGVIAPLTGFLIAGVIVIPAIEKVKECFSSQEKSSNCTANDSNESGQQPSSTLKSVDPLNVEDKDKGLVT